MVLLKCWFVWVGVCVCVEVCDFVSVDDCERCVLRAFGRGARGRGNMNDNDWDDVVEDEVVFESDCVIMLDCVVEFLMYVDEMYVIDSDCKFLVFMFRVEMVSRVVELFFMLFVEV